MGNVESNKLQMTCGVPQGSTLGPLLFLPYINDMPNCSKKLSFRIFADDTNIFYSSTNIWEVESVMKEELTNIQHYCAINKLSINLKKTNFMIISAKRKVLQPIHITEMDYIKYLGV